MLKKLVKRIIRNVSDGDRRIWKLADAMTVYEALELIKWAEE